MCSNATIDKVFNMLFVLHTKQFLQEYTPSSCTPYSSFFKNSLQCIVNRLVRSNCYLQSLFIFLILAMDGPYICHRRRTTVIGSKHSSNADDTGAQQGRISYLLCFRIFVIANITRKWTPTTRLPMISKTRRMPKHAKIARTWRDTIVAWSVTVRWHINEARSAHCWHFVIDVRWFVYFLCRQPRAQTAHKSDYVAGLKSYIWGLFIQRVQGLCRARLFGSFWPVQDWPKPTHPALGARKPTVFLGVVGQLISPQTRVWGIFWRGGNITMILFLFFESVVLLC